jgi:uncharacterized membrane protein YdjX (TVP38/TMEM64 family)
MNKQSIQRIILSVIIIAIFVVLLYYYLDKRGLIAFFSSRERLQSYILSFGMWAPLAFVAIQVLQVILAPIPGNVITVAGGLVFGFWISFLISTVAILLGSIICFILAKNYGRPLVIKLVGEKTTEKYLNSFFVKRKSALILMFLFPFFPDDALCLIAGLTTMKLKHFIILVLSTRPLGIIFSSLFGSNIINVSIKGWIIIGAFSVIIFTLVLKYGPGIENALRKWYKSRVLKTK